MAICRKMLPNRQQIMPKPLLVSKHIRANKDVYKRQVQHDINGLIDLGGGKNRFAEKLDSMFTYHPAADDELPIFSTGMIGQYAHGNEPSHHVIYLFNAIGHENRTQEYVAKVMNELYKNEPAGLCGNEDRGQMSAWYVFSAMGFYPVNPVSGKYEIGTPLFPEMQLHLANGKTFTVLFVRSAIAPDTIVAAVAQKTV